MWTLANEDVEQERLSYPQHLLNALQKLRHSVVSEGNSLYHSWQPLIERKQFAPSAENLAYYLALRRHDIRPLQLALMRWGLSSLGRIESRVLPNLDAVMATLGAVCHQDPTYLPKHPLLEDFFQGDRLLHLHTEEVFGQISSPRSVRIMVTLPTEAAYRYDLMRELLQRGTDCIRINCAHDSPEQWQAMINHLRHAEQETGRKCKVFMDLAGPKIRTGVVLYPISAQRLHQGDTLLLTPTPPTVPAPDYFQASCSIPSVCEKLTPGATLWIDDGQIGAVVQKVDGQGVWLQITHARPKGEKLRPEKGLNFPDTLLDLEPLTPYDRTCLDFVATHADIIGYSFVQKPGDIEILQMELAARLPEDWRKIALVAKIETPLAVKNLPDLIIHAAGKQPLGVMIARGDLAVEIGYQRLAEIQEEILWLCQAAHIPVIWATQVLENLVKKSIPSRAEITDAAMAERAECVMLNKGAFVEEAVTTLDDVLTRMQAHQSKKTPQLRALKSW